MPSQRKQMPWTRIRYRAFFQAGLVMPWIAKSRKFVRQRSSSRWLRPLKPLGTNVRMSASNIIAFFIMVTAAATIHPHQGAETINSAQQAAEALRPAAGRAAEVLFALGIIGTGLLAVPVLAGSAAYGVGEALKWPTGIDRKAHKAKGFYGILAASTLVGLAINIPALHVNPIRALVWAAVINGVAAVPVMIITMLMFSRKSIMGPFTRTGHMLRVVGWIATGVMTVAAGLYLVGL